VRIESGAESCAPRTDDECAMATRLRFDDDTRLACQTRLVPGTADLTVRRLVIDALDLDLATATARATGRVGCELDLAVLFADIAGFTTLSEDLPAYDVVHLLDRWFAVAGPAVEGHGGRIDNYMGDGLMAVFGATPAAGAPDPAQCGVRAALALVAAAADVDRYTREIYRRGFAVRVGVHFGPVVVGTLGAAHNRRETAIGDAVNVAARLEAANKEIGSAVLVSDVVAARLGPAFRLGRTAEIALKGKSGVHRVIEVVGAE
jgi:adenylate cyclase